jgi:enoyl-CoA hydratase
VGLGHALYLLETGIRIDAARALAMGLVEEVVPEGRALARAVELAEAMAAYPQASLRSDRSAALAALGLPLPRGLALEAEAGGRAVSDPEMAEGLARFAWGDRPESPVPPEETSLES